MYKLYYIVTDKSNGYYIGMTKSSLITRFNQHKSACNRGIKNILYDHMRKYGVESYLICLVDEFSTHKECCEAEVLAILNARKLNHNILNLADGGEGGFNVQDILSWKEKLSKSRKGYTPFKGKSHTAETKKCLSKIAKNYWKEHLLYDKESLIGLSFKEANKLLGISKTHFYRLKRLLIND